MERHGLQFGKCLSPTSSDDFVSQRAMSIVQTSVRRHESDTQSIAGPCGGHCHSPAAEWETFCVFHANEHFIESRGKAEASRSIRGGHTATADGCSGAGASCSCILGAVGWQFVRTLPQLAMRMQRRCAGGHVHVQRIQGQQMPARTRRASVTSLRQTRDRLETAQSVAAVDDMSGEEGSGHILGRPHSSVQTSLKRLHVNLGLPKTTSQYVISGTHT